MKISITLIALVLIITSCSSSKKTEESAANSDSLAVADTTTYPENLEASSFPNGELVHETGLLKNIEDSGYPFFTLTFEFPERNFEETFSLNLEEVKEINQATLTKAKGKYLDFGYVSNIENALLDIKDKNKTILEGEAIELPKDLKKITGVLSGAAEETQGDLPGNISVTTPSGEKVDFEFFITPNTVKYNNKTVTAFYEERTSNKIVEMKILK